jgi:hypothetical protein
MAINRSVDRQTVSVAETQLARVAGDGCARHPHLNALLEASGPHTGRDLSDAVHLLCSLHGRYPGLIELTLQRSTAGPARAWLAQASEAFERERLYLVRLTSAVGPLPSTPAAAETEASLVAARHALETLAHSERKGCALGAATALVGDWWPIRRLLDRAAARVGLQCPASSLPDEASVVGAIEACSDGLASERALAFGGEQLLLQHRALFDLLEARAEARGDY